MNKLRVGLLALVLALTSACEGGITTPGSENIVTGGSGGMISAGQPAANIVTGGSGGRAEP